MVGKRSSELNNLAHDSFWNPVASGAGMNLTAGAVPANRATDVSAAGVGVDAQAVAAAVAKQVDATNAAIEQEIDHARKIQCHEARLDGISLLDVKRKLVNEPLEPETKQHVGHNVL